jgi:hypothetical protein
MFGWETYFPTGGGRTISREHPESSPPFWLHGVTIIGTAQKASVARRAAQDADDLRLRASNWWPKGFILLNPDANQ